ncbi:MAG: FAD-dependent oxidoreductase, partial [Leptolinea sp.]
AQTEMGQGCHLLTAEQTAAQHGAVLSGHPVQGALWSAHERRVESRYAIPKLAAWIESLGVTFLRRTLVKEVQKGRVLTTSGVVEAAQVVVCPGDDMLTLYPEVIARHQITRCRFQ